MRERIFIALGAIVTLVSVFLFILVYIIQKATGPGIGILLVFLMSLGVGAAVGGAARIKDNKLRKMGMVFCQSCSKPTLKK